MTAIPWPELLGSTPIEIIATLSAILGVAFIARQNILGWPLGMVWAVLSAWLAFTQWQLVSDGILYLAYIPIQLYCWIVWHRRQQTDTEHPFIPSWMPHRKQLGIALVAVLCIVLWARSLTSLAAAIRWVPQPALLWRDSATTVLNFFAQFLQARKRMENWVVWLVVNLLGMHIYWIKGAPIYSIQYGFFLVLGIYGWMQWHRSSKQASAQ